MTRKSWTVLLAASSLAVLAFVILSQASGQGSSTNEASDVDVQATLGDRASKATANELPCTAEDAVANFDLFSLGDSYQGLPLTTIIRRCDNSTSSGDGSANYVSYIYGDCTPPPGSDSGCAPPFEVQVWPACERTFADYDDGTLSMGSISEIPSADFGDRVELYSGDATVVVFGPSEKSALSAAESVAPAGDAVAPTAVPEATDQDYNSHLRPPEEGATAGKLTCDGSSNAP